MSPTKGAWLWSRDGFKILPFAVMQRVARVRQRQLNYVLLIINNNNNNNNQDDIYGAVIMAKPLRESVSYTHLTLPTILRV